MASTAAEQDERKIVSVASNASQDIKTAGAASRISSQNGASPSPSLNSKDFIVSAAANIASQPLQNYDSNVWGVLTAISSNARKRRQVCFSLTKPIFFRIPTLIMLSVLVFWNFRSVMRFSFKF